MSFDVNGIQVSGFFDDKFAPVVEIFAEQIRSGQDLGASFALSKDGEMVMDIWGGHLDQEKTRDWQENTIVNVYSSTKTASFLCALLLASRGQLDFDANVMDYWPEFGAAGKEQVKVWHLMNHAAGLSGMDVPVTAEDTYDWDKMTSLLAAQAPWWEPGTASGYHALTQGWLIGEVVRRISGKSIGTFLAEEIAGPLSADFFIGVPESEFHRIGNLIPDPDAQAVGSDSAALNGLNAFPVITLLNTIQTASMRSMDISPTIGGKFKLERYTVVCSESCRIGSAEKYKPNKREAGDFLTPVQRCAKFAQNNL